DPWSRRGLSRSHPENLIRCGDRHRATRSPRRDGRSGLVTVAVNPAGIANEPLETSVADTYASSASTSTSSSDATDIKPNRATSGASESLPARRRVDGRCRPPLVRPRPLRRSPGAHLRSLGQLLVAMRLQRRPDPRGRVEVAERRQRLLDTRAIRHPAREELL